jgi:hypothetical protein
VIQSLRLNPDPAQSRAELWNGAEEGVMMSAKAVVEWAGYSWESYETAKPWVTSASVLLAMINVGPEEAKGAEEQSFVEVCSLFLLEPRHVLAVPKEQRHPCFRWTVADFLSKWTPLVEKWIELHGLQATPPTIDSHSTAV